MDWSSMREEEDRRTLQGMVVLLLSFACLAECACAAPSFVRGLLLGILTRAETVARDFAVGMGQDHGVLVRLPASDALAAVCPSDSRADAMRLAQSFRALAALIARLASRSSGDRRSRFAANAAAGRVMTAVRPAGAISSLLAEARTLQFGPAARLTVEHIDSS